MRVTPRPEPTRDLDTPDEIAEMVRRFYADVAQDELLGPMFNEVAQVDWSEHLPKLAAFWSRALLGRTGYQGNPFRAHQLVHAQREFTPRHFERWLTLFHETLELGWTGPNTRRALDLADNVARVHRRQLLGQPLSADVRETVGHGAAGRVVEVHGQTRRVEIELAHRATEAVGNEPDESAGS